MSTKICKKFNYVTQLKHANPLACRIGGYLHDSLFAKNFFKNNPPEPRSENRYHGKYNSDLKTFEYSRDVGQTKGKSVIGLK